MAGLVPANALIPSFRPRHSTWQVAFCFAPAPRGVVKKKKWRTFCDDHDEEVLITDAVGGGRLLFCWPAPAVILLLWAAPERLVILFLFLLLRRS